jgi:hypothetical protein
MKFRKNNIEHLIYVLLCIFSFGSVYILRVIISQGIKYALEEDKK